MREQCMTGGPPLTKFVLELVHMSRSGGCIAWQRRPSLLGRLPFPLNFGCLPSASLPSLLPSFSCVWLACNGGEAGSRARACANHNPQRKVVKRKPIGAALRVAYSCSGAVWKRRKNGCVTAPPSI